MAPKLTVAICTLDRAQEVRRCLSSLVPQSTDASMFEVLIVDNGPTDDVAAVANEFQDAGLAVRYVQETHRGLTYARRRAWKEARGDYVGFLDDDAVAHPDWVRVAIEAFEEAGPTVAILAGPVHDVRELTEPWPFTDSPVSGGFSLGTDSRDATPDENFWGGNLLVRRDVLVELDGFGEPLGHRDGRPGANEDIIIQRQVERAGWRRVYDPRLQIVHSSWRAMASDKQLNRLAFYTGVDDTMMARLLGANSWHDRRGTIVHRLGRLKAQCAADFRYNRAGDAVQATQARRAIMHSLGALYGAVWPLGHPGAKPRD